MNSKTIPCLLFIFLSFSQLFALKSKQTDSLILTLDHVKDTVYVNTLINIGRIYRTTDIDSALFYLNKAENRAKEINYIQGYLKSLMLQGNISYTNNKYSEALYFYTIALKFSIEHKENLYQAKCLERMASLNLTTNNPNLALKLYFESLAIFEELNDQKGIAKVYNIIGVYYAEKDDFDMAESYLNKSLEIHQQLNDKHNIIENKGNLGYLYELMGDINKAETIYKELIPEIQEVNNDYALTVIYYNLSGLQQKKGNLTDAMIFLHKALNIAEHTHDTALLSSLYGNMGELLLKKEELDSSTFYLEKSILYAQTIGDFETECDAMMFLAKIDSVSGDLESEVKRYKRIDLLKEEIQEQQIKYNIRAIELEYQNKKNQNLIDLQQQVIESDKNKKQLYIIIFIVFGIAVLLLIVMVIISKKTIQKNKKIHDQQNRLKQMEMDKIKNDEKFHKLQKEKAENELMSKNRELAYGALQLEQKQKLLSYISRSIKDIISKDKNNPYNTELETLEKSFKLMLKDQTDHDLFNKQFNQVHQEFFNQLKTSHPGLTKTELKFCAYLRLQLSTAQISSFLNVTSDAIRKTRYRIRKKIGLDPNDSLEDYIMKF